MRSLTRSSLQTLSLAGATAGYAGTPPVAAAFLGCRSTSQVGGLYPDRWTGRPLTRPLWGSGGAGRLTVPSWLTLSLWPGWRATAGGCFCAALAGMLAAASGAARVTAATAAARAR